MNTTLTKSANTLVSKRGSWFVLGGVVILVTLLFGLLSGAGEDRANESAPADSESTQTAQLLQKFPDADKQSVMVVATHDDGSVLSDTDQSELGKLSGSLGDYIKSSQKDESGTDAASGDEASKASGPIMSEDGKAALLMVPIEVGVNNSDTAETVDGLRDFIADDSQAAQLQDSGMSLLVTGGPAIGADITSAFGGADFTEEALFVSWFGMWLNGVGSLLAVVLFAKHLRNIQNKVVEKNPRILAIVAGAAMCAIYGNLSSSTVLNGTDYIGAWLAGGFAAFVFYHVSQKHEKLKEYSLGLAMIIGTIVGALIQAFL